ncbi:UNVERIFIED_CONTAM: phosphate ABC transporter membrane protein 2 (PhoT family) [Acetivibrio alkalicellulosi]
MSTRIKDRLLYIIICAISFITLGILVWIMAYIITKGLPYISWEFLTTDYRGDREGILPSIVTTLYLIIISLSISTPIGIGTAIYLVEYSKPGKTIDVIRFAIVTLAGIPSIIYGLFGYMFFVIALNYGNSFLAGGMTISIMVLPTIIRTTEEALKAVPKSFREGSLALGATKLTTIIKIVLPSAIPGILAAIILSIGRIVGETAVLIFTLGTATGFPTSIMDSARTLSVHLYMLAKEGLSFEQAFATATVLLIITAFINFISSKIALNIKRFAMGSKN